MNTQRIIVIIFIVVALLIAGYFALGIYQSNQQDSNRNQIISTLYEIGNNVQQYHEKSSGQGGGSSYASWIMPDKYRKTPDGTFNFVARLNMVNLSGVGTMTGRNGITNVRAIAKVDSSGIQITVIN